MQRPSRFPSPVAVLPQVMTVTMTMMIMMMMMTAAMMFTPGGVNAGVIIASPERSRSPVSEGSISRQCYVGDGVNATFFPCNKEPGLRPRVLPQEVSIMETTEMPKDPNHYPEIGNGHVATVVHSDTVYMNGLYNGPNVTSHRARLPSTAAVMVTVTSTGSNVTGPIFRLDVGRGVFSEQYNGSGFSVEVRRYAHRQLTRLLVTEVLVQPTTFTLPITLTFTTNTGNNSTDVDLTEEEPGLWTGRTRQAEYPEVNGTTPVTIAFSVVPPVLTFDPSTDGAVAFLSSISPYKADALWQFQQGKALLTNGTLFSSHVNTWEEVWQRGRIELKGNDSLALSTNAAMYYLLTALPLTVDADWPFVGLSPGGLAHGGYMKDYQGHVFWDQDTWMFPGLALLHADLGRLIVDTRIRTLHSALDHANQTGYAGARYSWESGFTGLPVSPSMETGEYEVHVTGDAAWMMRQYLQLTNDTGFLSDGHGLTALSAIADFWLSRSQFNATSDRYEILGVMGPDEWHYPVNNSVYTNLVAVQSARTALLAASLLDQTPNPSLEKLAANMWVPFDPQNQYHPEYDSYTNGTTVKQADVVMLGFPLKWSMSEQVRRNDLTYYASMTPGGPAMTWSVFTINWLRLGDTSQAHTAFSKSTRNIQLPFRVWSEVADGSGAYNFQTGMGGHLQALLYGYLGADLSDNSLDLHPQLPTSVTLMGVRDVDYLGGSFDVTFDAFHMNVTLTKSPTSSSLSPPSPSLSLLVKATGEVIGLEVGKPITLARQAVSVERGGSSSASGAASLAGAWFGSVFVMVWRVFGVVWDL